MFSIWVGACVGGEIVGGRRGLWVHGWPFDTQAQLIGLIDMLAWLLADHHQPPPCVQAANARLARPHGLPSMSQ